MPTGDASDDVDNAATVSVLLPLPLAAPYDYRVPEGLAVAPGDHVAVPLGRRRTQGVVWGPSSGEVAAGRLRDIEAVLPAPRMADAMRRLVDWVARYTLAPPGAVLRMALGPDGAFAPGPVETVYRLAPGGAEALEGARATPARRRLVAFLADGHALPAAELARVAGVGTGVVKGLAASGILAAETREPARRAAEPDWRLPGIELGEAQRAAAALLREKVAARAFSVTLLDGVPGAGKTEVYFEAIAAALEAGRQSLVLLPEIALTAQWLDRFARRFGGPPVEWHSDVGAADRRRAWRAVAENRAKVVVGARSALWLPFADLGLVAVDEEHDASFKQEDGVVYNARDMAVVRARLEAAPVVLASATPSLETWANVRAGRYETVRLPARAAGAHMPALSCLDLRKAPPARGRFLAPATVAALGDTLAAGEQALLYLNRRGYAPLTLCRGCGHRLECPNCRAWLVEHRFRGRLVCHHCGHGGPRPSACPACAAEDSFVACGPGVERVAEEAAALFPEARIEIFASDTVAGRGAALRLVERMAAGEIDILIGTQMAAKGFHFPNLTLVAVVDADLGLGGGDLRAAERTFQTLYQVAGRAGRAERPGRAILQTWMPEHPVMRALASGDRDRFVEAEMAAREAAGMPPFARLAAVIVSGSREDEVDRTARALGRAAPSDADLRVLGPAPAPLSLLRGRFRRRLLMVASRGGAVQAALTAWIGAVEVPPGVRVQIDIDPYSFM